MLQVSEHFSSALIALLVLVGMSGCGGSSGDGFSGARGQVSGKMTLDDKPLESGCQVIFISTKEGYTASGVVDDAGAYKLIYNGGAGMPAVEYQVQLTAPINTTPQDMNPSKMGANMTLGKKTKTEDAGPFPSKYGSTTTSKLSYTVKEGNNTADFPLSKK